MADSPPSDSFDLRVIISDLDAYRHANHGAYVRWLEEGREKLLRSRGSSFIRLAETGRRLVLVNLNLDFKGPADWNDAIRVESRVDRIGSRSVRFGHRIEGTGGKTLLTGRATMVFIDESGRSTAVPADFRAAFSRDEAGDGSAPGR